MNKTLPWFLITLFLGAGVAQAQTPYPYMPSYPPMMIPAPYGMPYYTMPYGFPAAPAATPPVMPQAQPTPVAPPDSSSKAPVAAPSVAAAPALTPATSLPAPAAPAAANPWLQAVQGAQTGFNPLNMLLTPPSGALKPYSMRRQITQQEKTQMMQMMLPIMTTFTRMGMPDMVNYMARKYKAKPGLTFDDVRDSLFLRANQLNMKKVGENLMWKDFQVVLEDKDAPRIEVYSFCDIAVGRELLKISPEFVVFLPCRVAVMEDANKEIWVLMIDWNMDWVAGFEKQLGLTDELTKGALSINQRMDEMMRAAANGDL
jgi:uncharacterized protein (DUF302 family)